MRKVKPSTILEKALALFGNRGQRWIKGTSCIGPGEMWKKKRYEQGAFCSIGAINKAENYNWSLDTRRFINQVVKKDIVSFNDRKTTTFPMVRKAFKKAIALAKAEGK